MYQLIKGLNSVLSSPVLTGADISTRYQHDWSAEEPGIPIAVARPVSTAEVSAILKICSE